MAVEGSGPGTSADHPVFHLWLDHELSFSLFFACRTQWRVGGLGDAIGLDYAGVEALIRMRRLVPRQQLPQVMGDLQILESATLEEWQAERERKERSSSSARRG